MAGIVVITAAREDAYRDYERSMRNGNDREDVAEYLSEDVLNTVTDPDSNKVHVWGTTVESKWRSVEPGDIALVYAEGRYIAQATVADTMDNLDLARYLWKDEDSHWDPTKPWQYITFFADVESIDVGIEDFNELVGYDENYRPRDSAESPTGGLSG